MIRGIPSRTSFHTICVLQVVEKFAAAQKRQRVEKEQKADATKKHKKSKSSDSARTKEVEAENKVLRAKTAKQKKVINEMKQVVDDLKAKQPPSSPSEATADPLSQPTADLSPQPAALANIERQLAILGATPTQSQSSAASLQDARNRQESELRHERNMETLRVQIEKVRQHPMQDPLLGLFDSRDFGAMVEALFWHFIGSVLAIFWFSVDSLLALTNASLSSFAPSSPPSHYF
jgi:hypothetical protein